MINKAIKHFEALQKRYTTQHNGKMCDYVAIALDAMKKQLNTEERIDCEYISEACGKNLLQKGKENANVKS